MLQQYSHQELSNFLYKASILLSTMLILFTMTSFLGGIWGVSCSQWTWHSHICLAEVLGQLPRHHWVSVYIRMCIDYCIVCVLCVVVWWTHQKGDDRAGSKKL